MGKRKHGSIGSRIRKRAKKSELWKEFSLWFYSEPCFWCQEEMNEIQNDKRQRTADHINTFKEGGGLFANNLIPCCEECNNKRGNMDFITYGIIHILSKEYNISVLDFVKEYNRYNDSVFN